MRTNKLDIAKGPRVKADYKPEIFFLGQIVGGTDFPTEQDGIFVEASVKYGNEWKPFHK